MVGLIDFLAYRKKFVNSKLKFLHVVLLGSQTSDKLQYLLCSVLYLYQVRWDNG